MTRNRGAALALTLALGLQIRSLILAIGPALPAIRHDLHLSYAWAGALGAIPLVAFAAAALPGARLASRFGARTVVAGALLLVALAAELRLAWPPLLEVFLWTSVLALAIGLVQPLTAAVVNSWFPRSVQRGAAAYAVSVNLGGLLGSTLTVFLVAALGWRLSFALWGIPPLLVALAWLLAAPPVAGREVPRGLGELLRSRLAAQVGLMFGMQGIVYFTAAIWIPFRVSGYGGGAVATALLILNLSNLASNLVLARSQSMWSRSRAFYMAAGAIMAAGSAGVAFGSQWEVWIATAVLGAGIGMGYTGITVIPAQAAATPSAASDIAAVVMTLGYAIAFAGPQAGGLLVDATRALAAPFIFMMASSAVFIVLAATLPVLRAAERGGLAAAEETA